MTGDDQNSLPPVLPPIAGGEAMIADTPPMAEWDAHVVRSLRLGRWNEAIREAISLVMRDDSVASADHAHLGGSGKYILASGADATGGTSQLEGVQGAMAALRRDVASIQLQARSDGSEKGISRHDELAQEIASVKHSVEAMLKEPSAELARRAATQADAACSQLEDLKRMFDEAVGVAKTELPSQMRDMQAKVESLSDQIGNLHKAVDSVTGRCTDVACRIGLVAAKVEERVGEGEARVREGTLASVRQTEADLREAMASQGRRINEAHARAEDLHEELRRCVAAGAKAASEARLAAEGGQAAAEGLAQGAESAAHAAARSAMAELVKGDLQRLKEQLRAEARLEAEAVRLKTQGLADVMRLFAAEVRLDCPEAEAQHQRKRLNQLLESCFSKDGCSGEISALRPWSDASTTLPHEHSSVLDVSLETSTHDLVAGSSRELKSHASRDLPSQVERDDGPEFLGAAGMGDGVSKGVPPASQPATTGSRSEDLARPSAKAPDGIAPPGPSKALRSYKLSGGTGESHSPPSIMQPPLESSDDSVHVAGEASTEVAGEGSGSMAIERSCRSCPPANRNAKVRAELPESTASPRRRYVADWDKVSATQRTRPAPSIQKSTGLPDPRTARRTRAARDAYDSSHSGNAALPGCPSPRGAAHYNRQSGVAGDEPDPGLAGRIRAHGLASTLPRVVDYSAVDDNLEWSTHLSDVRGTLGRVRFADMTSYMTQKRPLSTR